MDKQIKQSLIKKLRSKFVVHPLWAVYKVLSYICRHYIMLKTSCMDCFQCPLKILLYFNFVCYIYFFLCAFRCVFYCVCVCVLVYFWCVCVRVYMRVGGGVSVQNQRSGKLCVNIHLSNELGNTYKRGIPRFAFWEISHF